MRLYVLCGLFSSESGWVRYTYPDTVDTPDVCNGTDPGPLTKINGNSLRCRVYAFTRALP